MESKFKGQTQREGSIPLIKKEVIKKQFLALVHVIVGRFSEKQNKCWVHLGQSFLSIYFQCRKNIKVEKILKGSLDLVSSPSPSVKIQIMCGKVCLKCKGKTLLGVVNLLFVFKCLLTSPSNVLPYYLK